MLTRTVSTPAGQRQFRPAPGSVWRRSAVVGRAETGCEILQQGLALTRTPEPNLSWITRDLAIGGRLAEHELANLGHAGVSAVVDLRREAVDEEAVLRRQGLAFLHLPTEDHAALASDDITRGVDFAARCLSNGARLLVHCEHGIGRSATLALCILVDRGMDPLAALELAKTMRSRVSPSPAQYEGWRGWLEARRAAGRRDLAIPDFESFAAIAYRHLRRDRA